MVCISPLDESMVQHIIFLPKLAKLWGLSRSSRKIHYLNCISRYRVDKIIREKGASFFSKKHKLHTLAKLLKLPKVTKPLLRAGAAETEPASGEGV